MEGMFIQRLKWVWVYNPDISNANSPSGFLPGFLCVLARAMHCVGLDVRGRVARVCLVEIFSDSWGVWICSAPRRSKSAALLSHGLEESLCGAPTMPARGHDSTHAQFGLEVSQGGRLQGEMSEQSSHTRASFALVSKLIPILGPRCRSSPPL